MNRERHNVLSPAEAHSSRALANEGPIAASREAHPFAANGINRGPCGSVRRHRHAQQQPAYLPHAQDSTIGAEATVRLPARTFVNTSIRCRSRSLIITQPNLSPSETLATGTGSDTLALQSYDINIARTVAGHEQAISF